MLSKPLLYIVVFSPLGVMPINGVVIFSPNIFLVWESCGVSVIWSSFSPRLISISVGLVVICFFISSHSSILTPFIARILSFFYILTLCSFEFANVLPTTGDNLSTPINPSIIYSIKANKILKNGPANKIIIRFNGLSVL